MEEVEEVQEVEVEEDNGALEVMGGSSKRSRNHNYHHHRNYHHQTSGQSSGPLQAIEWSSGLHQEIIGLRQETTGRSHRQA